MNLDLDKYFLKVSSKDKGFFFRQLSTMLESGLPIAQALTIIASQTKKQGFKKVINEIIEDIESGISFSTAIANHPNIFSKFEIAIVRAGEASGKTTNVLGELARSVESDTQFSGKVKSAMMYPAFILLAMVVVVYIMMTRVLPSLTSVFNESGVELPWSTKLLMAISYGMIHYGWLILIILIAICVGIKLYFGSPEGALVYSRMNLNIPLFGTLNQKIYMSRFARTLAMLSDSGVPIVESIEIVAAVMANKIYSKSLVKCARDIERGIPLSVPISKNPYFPQIVSQMILVGEQTGKIDEVLYKLSDYFEGEVDTELKGLVSLVEPAMLILVGLGVAFIVFAVLLPIYSITSSIK